MYYFKSRIVILGFSKNQIMSGMWKRKSPKFSLSKCIITEALITDRTRVNWKWTELNDCSSFLSRSSMLSPSSSVFTFRKNVSLAWHSSCKRHYSFYWTVNQVKSWKENTTKISPSILLLKSLFRAKCKCFGWYLFYQLLDSLCYLFLVSRKLLQLQPQPACVVNHEKWDLRLTAKLADVD